MQALRYIGENMLTVHGVVSRAGRRLKVLAQQDPEIIGTSPPSHRLGALWRRPSEGCSEKATSTLTRFRSSNSAPC